MRGKSFWKYLPKRTDELTNDFFVSFLRSRGIIVVSCFTARVTAIAPDNCVDVSFLYPICLYSKEVSLSLSSLSLSFSFPSIFSPYFKSLYEISTCPDSTNSFLFLLVCLSLPVSLHVWFLPSLSSSSGWLK